MLFKPILPVLEYVVLHDYIKNELCVNKNKPELECNGKCHLKKELAKASQSENGKEKSYSFSVEYAVVFCQDIFTQVSFVLTEGYVNKTLFSKQITYTFNFSRVHFRPPSN